MYAGSMLALVRDSAVGQRPPLFSMAALAVWKLSARAQRQDRRPHVRNQTATNGTSLPEAWHARVRTHGVRAASLRSSVPRTLAQCVDESFITRPDGLRVASRHRTVIARPEAELRLNGNTRAPARYTRHRLPCAGLLIGTSMLFICEAPGGSDTASLSSDTRPSREPPVRSSITLATSTSASK
eukprot:218532-Prymnesium_polylepis.1